MWPQLEEMIMMGRHITYSEDTKRLILDQVKKKKNESKKRDGILKKITSAEHSPCRETIWRWKQKQKIGVVKGSKIQKKGRPEKLTEHEYQILGGRIISRCKHGKKVDINFIRQIVLEFFGIEVSKTWASRAAIRLGFKSKKTREGYTNANDATKK